MIGKFKFQWPTYDYDQLEVTVKKTADRDEHGKFRYEVRVFIDRILLWQTHELYCPNFYDEVEVVATAISFCVYDLEGKHGEEPRKWGVQLADDLSSISLDINEKDENLVYFYNEVEEDWWDD